MGWKTLKEEFGIQHLVAVTDKGVCIGSQYVHDLIVIDPKTGKVQEHPTFSSLVRDKYPQLLEAAPERIVEILAAPDVFSASITVYTYEDGEIIEKKCEEPGWPNVTHDGCMMHDNTYSTDKDKVVEWAKRNVELRIQYAAEDIADREQELTRRRARLAEAEAARATLEANYPTVNAKT